MSVVAFLDDKKSFGKADLEKRDIEIDFIISNNSKTKYRIYPIEVKSGARYSTVSLQRFR